jgi:hypothetical protein
VEQINIEKGGLHMIKMQTAYTTEIDEIDDAVAEIVGQLDLTKLEKNSVGIIVACYDFIESEVVHALCEHLPFSIIGMSTMGNASKYGLGMYGLCLTVLTSSEVEFATALTQPLNLDNYKQEIDSAYKNTLASIPGAPAFIISFFPYMHDVSVADLVKTFSASCNDIPIWGSVSSGLDTSYDHCRTIWNGKVEQHSLAMLLCYGPIEPEFFVTAIPDRNIREDRAIITGSDGCTLKSINGVPAQEYMNSLNISVYKGEYATIPLLVYYNNDSNPVALGIYTSNDDGSVLCAGEMPEGAAIGMGIIDSEGIIETARESINTIFKSSKKNGLLMLPCVTRYVMLAPNQNSEMEYVSEALGEKIPYMLAYSGGEICPMRGEDGKWHNHLHNFSFNVCIF